MNQNIHHKPRGIAPKSASHVLRNVGPVLQLCPFPPMSAAVTIFYSFSISSLAPTSNILLPALQAFNPSAVLQSTNEF